MRRVDVVALTLLVLVMSSLVVSGAPLLQDARRVVTCANNLKQLWRMQAIYMAQFGGRDKLMPPDTGEAFWLKLSQTVPPLIDPSLSDIYQCPVENVMDEGCDYRGPAEDVNSYKDGDPVGADVDGNHGVGRGGNVIRKSGDVLAVSVKDPLWKAAEVRLKGGNKAIPPKEFQETVKQKQACVDLGHLLIAVQLYREFMGMPPKSLSDLLEKPKDATFWPEGGFIVGGKLPKDPWGNDYQYQCYMEGKLALMVWTWGADGKKGGEGEDRDLSIGDVFVGRTKATDEK